MITKAKVLSRLVKQEVIVSDNGENCKPNCQGFICTGEPWESDYAEFAGCERYRIKNLRREIPGQDLPRKRCRECLKDFGK